MSQASFPHPPGQIRRTFEPNRLASMHLAEAYEQIVPIHVRILAQLRHERKTRQGSDRAAIQRKGRAA